MILGCGASCVILLQGGHPRVLGFPVHCAETVTAPWRHACYISRVLRGIMKKLATIIAVAGLIGTSAFAADMAVKAPPPVPALLYSWTGFYVGLNAGWNWTEAKTTTLIVASATSSFADSGNGDGLLGGVQFGYNWKNMSNWI